jgi:hypothetical protein
VPPPAHRRPELISNWTSLILPSHPPGPPREGGGGQKTPSPHVGEGRGGSMRRGETIARGSTSQPQPARAGLPLPQTRRPCDESHLDRDDPEVRCRGGPGGEARAEGRRGRGAAGPGARAGHGRDGTGATQDGRQRPGLLSASVLGEAPRGRRGRLGGREGRVVPRDGDHRCALSLEGQGGLQQAVQRRHHDGGQVAAGGGHRDPGRRSVRDHRGEFGRQQVSREQGPRLDRGRGGQALADGDDLQGRRGDGQRLGQPGGGGGPRSSTRPGRTTPR